MKKVLFFSFPIVLVALTTLICCKKDEPWKEVHYAGMTIRCPQYFEIDTFENRNYFEHNIYGSEPSSKNMQFCITWMDFELSPEKMLKSFEMSGNKPKEVVHKDFHGHKALLLKYIHGEYFSHILIFSFNGYSYAIDLASKDEKSLYSEMYQGILDNIQFPDSIKKENTNTRKKILEYVQECNNELPMDFSFGWTILKCEIKGQNLVYTIQCYGLSPDDVEYLDSSVAKDIQDRILLELNEDENKIALRTLLQLNEYDIICKYINEKEEELFINSISSSDL